MTPLEELTQVIDDWVSAGNELSYVTGDAESLAYAIACSGLLANTPNSAPTAPTGATTPTPRTQQAGG